MTWDCLLDLGHNQVGTEQSPGTWEGCECVMGTGHGEMEIEGRQTYEISPRFVLNLGSKTKNLDHRFRCTDVSWRAHAWPKSALMSVEYVEC